MLSSVPAPDDQCPRVLDQIDDIWEWLGDKLVKLPARRPVVQFPPGSLHRIAPVRDVISTSESSPVPRISSESSPVFLRPHQTWEATLSGSPDLRRGCVLTEGAKQTASHASAHSSISSSLLFFVLSLLSSVLRPTSQPFFLSPLGRSEPFPCIAWPRLFCRGDAFLALHCLSLLTKT